MKLFLFITAFLFCFNSYGASNLNTKAPLTQVRNVYSSVNVTTASYVQLIASTGAATSLIDIYDSSTQTLVLGVGGAGVEVVYAIIPPGGIRQLPIGIPKASRIAIKSLSATANSGEIDLSLFK